MQGVRDFIGSRATILGNPATKHGEIAEQVHVGVRRALDVLHGRVPSASFEGVNRLGPIDYRDGGIDIQSKYSNGLRNTLEQVIGHTKNYPEFGPSGGAYNIPSDQHRQLEQFRQSRKIDGLSDKSARAIQRKLDLLEETTGRRPDDLIQSGEASYEEVQKGSIHDTVGNREKMLADRNEELKDAARAAHQPSLAGAAKAATAGAVAGAGVRLAQAFWVKYRDGKNPFNGDFSLEDWRDVGVATAKGAGGGAVTGGALYVITNSTDLAAPFAGALVSGLMGVGELLRQYRGGKIDSEQFVELSHIIAVDTAIVGLASAAGQALIPFPVLGAFLGSLAGKLVASAIKDGLGSAEAKLHARLKAYEQRALERLNEEHRSLVKRMDCDFGNLKSLAQRAFDKDVNTSLRLQASVHLALSMGVRDEQILKTTEALDAFMLE